MFGWGVWVVWSVGCCVWGVWGVVCGVGCGGWVWVHPCGANHSHPPPLGPRLEQPPPHVALAAMLDSPRVLYQFQMQSGKCSGHMLMMMMITLNG